jgi:uncharacterized MAPEG superfamily protein
MEATTALIGFAGWYVLLTLVVASYRVYYAFGIGKELNSFAVDGRDLDPLGHRLTRARDNCYETLPIFAALFAAAHAMGSLAVLNGLAMWVLYARIGQSITHVASTSSPAVLVRAGLFTVQVLIYLYWTIALLG